MASVFDGDPSGRPANVTADVEQAIASLGLQYCGRLLNRDHPLTPEMIDWRQGVGCDRHIQAVYRSKRSQSSCGDAFTP